MRRIAPQARREGNPTSALIGLTAVAGRDVDVFDDGAPQAEFDEQAGFKEIAPIKHDPI